MVAFVEGCADGGRSCGLVPIRLVVVLTCGGFVVACFYKNRLNVKANCLCLCKVKQHSPH